MSEPFAYDRAAHEAAVLAWRRGRLARLTAPDGWLSLVGRSPLEEGESRVGSAPGCGVPLPADRAPPLAGTLRRAGAEVWFTPAPGVSVSVQGRDGRRALASGIAAPLRTDRDGAPDRLAVGAVTLEITDRGGSLFGRVRDPDGPARRAFGGLAHFPIDPKWRVVAHLEPYTPPKAVDLAYEAGGPQRYVSPGAALFEVDGLSWRLDPVYDSDGTRLYVVFWDPTARDATYGAGRFLYAPLPEGGRVLLDFNQAFSPPCAFTPYAACPLAPPQNRLALRVEAGEKRPSSPAG